MTVLYNKAARIFAGLIFQLIFLLSLQAQKRSAVTLESIIDSAQHHLPVLLEKHALLNSAEAAITEAEHSRLPQLKVLEEVSGSSSNNVAGAYFPMSTIPSVSGSIRNGNNFQPEIGNIGMLYSQYDLFDFGLKKANVQSAVAFASLAKSDADREQYLLKWQAGKAYFDLLQAEYQLGIDQQNLTRYEDIYKIIQAVTLSGLRPGSDSSEINAEISQTRINYNLTQGKVKQLQQQLSYFTGIAADNIFVDTTIQSLNIPFLPQLNETLDSARNPFLDFYTAQTNYYKANQ